MSESITGPLLFDTSAESWLLRSNLPEVREWLRAYLSRFRIHISAVTVLERSRGYSLLWRRADVGRGDPARKAAIENARVAWLAAMGKVLPFDGAVAVVAGEIMALLPEPPSPPRRTHHAAESRSERLSRWRFDIMIAATALVAGMPLLHVNPVDFETIRGAIERSPNRFPDLGPLELIRCERVIPTSRH
jgi:predicted nucleic acid-binding protein